MICKLLKWLAFKLRRRELWSIAIYRLNEKVDLNFTEKFSPIFLYSDAGKKYNTSYRSTCADPFLISNDSNIFLFFESKTDFDIGKISCISFNSNNPDDVIDYGVILSEQFHLSFPNVFKYGTNFFMIPECVDSGNVILYKADIFPTLWRKQKIILNLSLADIAIHFTTEGVYLLGTDSKCNLKLYFSRDIFSNFTLVENISSDDFNHKRNGGNFITIENQLFRVAQNSFNYYGESLTFKKINNLNPNQYNESKTDIWKINNQPNYMDMGHHHLSVLNCGRDVWIAIDGFKKNTYINLFKYIYVFFFIAFKNFFSYK
jgi:hypothetical protein